MNAAHTLNQVRSTNAKNNEYNMEFDIATSAMIIRWHFLCTYTSGLDPLLGTRPAPPKRRWQVYLDPNLLAIVRTRNSQAGPPTCGFSPNCRLISFATHRLPLRVRVPSRAARAPPEGGIERADGRKKSAHHMQSPVLQPARLHATQITLTSGQKSPRFFASSGLRRSKSRSS